MTTPNIIVVGLILALLSILSFMLLKLSSKEYPKTEEEQPRPKFEPRKMTDLSTPVEKPKRRYKRKNKKKKPAVANNETTEKRPVGRPKKTN